MRVRFGPTLDQATNHVTEVVRPKLAQRACGAEPFDHHRQDEWISDLFTGTRSVEGLLEAVRINARLGSCIAQYRRRLGAGCGRRRESMATNLCLRRKNACLAVQMKWACGSRAMKSR